MPCRGCGKRNNPSGTGGRKLAAHTPGNTVRLKYLGSLDDVATFEGAATRTEYVVGGRINLIDAYASDAATGISWAPGLLELTGEGGRKLFKVHVPLKEEIEAEKRAREMSEEAWRNAEALALPSEEPEPKRRKAKAKSKKEEEEAEPTETEVAGAEDSV